MLPRIRMIQVKNYKSLADVSVKLEPFTVFVGPNGSGKSNFVDALAFVRDCLEGTVDRAVQQRGGLWNLGNRKQMLLDKQQRVEAPEQDTADRPVHLAGTWPIDFGFRLCLELKDGVSVDYSFSISALEAPSLFRVSSFPHERCAVRSNGTTSEFEVKGGHFVKEVPGIRPKLSADRLALSLVSGTEEYLPVYDFLTSMRDYRIDPLRMREFQTPGQGNFLKSDGSNAASVLRILREQPNGERQWERLCRLMANVARGIIRVEHFSVGEKETISFLQDIGLQQRPSFFPSNISEGTLRVLGLLLAVLQPGNHPVIAIEEPEATVHPGIAEMIMEVLMSAAEDRQIIITTHSPDLLNHKELKDDQIRMVSWRDGQTFITKPSGGLHEVIEKHLYSPGELLSMGELEPDQEALKAPSVDLFGPAFPDEEGAE